MSTGEFQVTEHRGQVSNAPALYSVGPKFETWSRRPAIRTEGFLVFLSCCRQILW